MSFEQQWLEYDYNPFILFSSNAKIISLNTEAQFLLGATTNSELFELATTYASISFGFKTTFLELEFGRYKFFGITVGYEDDEQIGMRLYKTPTVKLKNPKTTGELINIYTLVDLCISTNSIGSKIKFIKEFDPTIPEIMIDSNSFIKILSKIYLCFKENSEINTKIYYRIGEHIKFEDKKYSIFSIEVSGAVLNEQRVNELQSLVSNSNFYMEIQNKITINIPMITA